MNRRDFMKVASGVAGGSAVAGATTSTTAGAQETTTESPSNNTTTNSGKGTSKPGSGGGGTKTVEVGPGGNPVFTPGTKKPLYIKPGTTVKFVWKSNNHNIHVDKKPEGSSWKGVSEIKNKGFSHSHTFETKGKFHYWCEPHKALGMVADIEVNDSGQPPGGGGGGGGHAEANPEHMGVPFQAHYVGIATVVMMIVSLIYTFFFLKYGESPNTSSPNR